MFWGQSFQTFTEEQYRLHSKGVDPRGVQSWTTPLVASLSQIVLLHNRIRYIRSHHCDLKTSQFLLTGGKELPKKLCICLSKVHLNALFLHKIQKKISGDGAHPHPRRLDAFGVSTLDYNRPPHTKPHTRL